jgi:Flp pilus assembly protein TadG
MHIVASRPSVRVPGPAREPAPAPGAARRGGRQHGQGLVEFALVVTPLLLLLLGIIQFGLIFNAYVTLTNASREAARIGSIYVYDRTLTKGQNDLVRNEAIRTSLTESMNLLSTSAPQFTTSGTWTQSGTTYANGDLSITYTLPAGITESDPRVGQRITVTAVYHHDLIIPLIAGLLPQDAGGRFALSSEVTMVIN